MLIWYVKYIELILIVTNLKNLLRHIFPYYLFPLLILIYKATSDIYKLNNDRKINFKSY